MPIRVSFDLHDADLRHLEVLAQQTQALARSSSSEAIIASAREVLDSSERARLAEFVKERFSRLRAMLAMATDGDWVLACDDRQRVLNALACFSVSPVTSVPMSAALPAATQKMTASFLDHAIMIELVSRDLEHDLASFQDFCNFRSAQLARVRPGMEDKTQLALQQKREALQARMHTRRQRHLDKAGSSVRKLFSLFGM